MSEKRNAYVAKMKAKLDKWNTDLDKLQAKVNRVGADTKVELQNHVQQLQAKRIEVGERIDGLCKTSDDAWRDLQTGVENSWKALDKATHSAIADFKRSASSENA